MKKSLLIVPVVVLIAVLAGGSAFAEMLDQFQLTQDAGIRVASNRALCQTFTAGLTGNLTKVSLQFSDNLLADEAAPATISILGTTLGLPNSTVLWTGSFSSLSPGWFDVNTSVGATYLTAGTVYGIRLTSSDSTSGNPDDLWSAMTSTGAVIKTDSYVNGQLFQNTGSGWSAVTVGTSLPNADAAFKTYVTPVPEPSTMAMFLIGLSAIITRRLCRRHPF